MTASWVRGIRSAIATLVERRTRYLILIGAFDGRPTAVAMLDHIASALLFLPPPLRRTLTWDRGKELAHHPEITERTGTRVFFCDAHSPWQRGSNENMNGLLNWSRKVGLGNRTLGDCGLLGAVFVGAEIVEPLLDSGGVPPVQVGS